MRGCVNLKIDNIFFVSEFLSSFFSILFARCIFYAVFLKDL